MKDNTLFMTDFDIDTLINENIIEKIAKKLLINLFSRGNLNAYDILTGLNNGQVTLEDITQEMLLFLCENNTQWYLLRSGGRFSSDEKRITLIFFNDSIQTEFFRIVSNTIYREKTRHDNKKIWLEIDGEEIKFDNITSLASHTCIDDVMTLSLYNSFCSYLLSSCKKYIAVRYINSINLRLQGYKYKDIAIQLNISLEKVKKDFQQLKILWKEFNK